MSEDGDSWLKSAFDFDVGQTLTAIQNKVADVGNGMMSADARETAPAPVQAPVQAPEAAPDASPGLWDRMKDAAASLGGGMMAADARETVTAPSPAPGDAPGIWDRVKETAGDVGQDFVDKGKAVLDEGNAAGDKVLEGYQDGWSAAKSGYQTVTGAWDAVAPNFNEANRDLGKDVDAFEASEKEAHRRNEDALAAVPVLGTAAKGLNWLEEKGTEGFGGIVKGGGDLVTMAGNAMLHPIDATESLGSGMLDAAEHVNIIPGAATTLKQIHGTVDILRGKKDGKYGADWDELNDNLVHDTQRDPNDPTKKVNTDVEYLSSFGGGRKAWEDKPLEALTRTATNILPMVLGMEEKAPPGEVPPEVPPPETPPPSAVDPFGKTQPATRPRGGPATTKPEPVTQRDPPMPDTERVPTSPRELTVEEAQRNVADAEAAQKAAEKGSVDAAGEFVRYRALEPNPLKGQAGDPAWDPLVDQALENEADRASNANVEAIHRLEEARKAEFDALKRQLAEQRKR